MADAGLMGMCVRVVLGSGVVLRKCGVGAGEVRRSGDARCGCEAEVVLSVGVMVADVACAGRGAGRLSECGVRSIGLEGLAVERHSWAQILSVSKVCAVWSGWVMVSGDVEMRGRSVGCDVALSVIRYSCGGGTEWGAVGAW